MKLEFSKYNIAFKEQNKFIIYNTLSGIIFSINEDAYYKLKKQTQRYVKSLSEDDLFFLIKNKILTDDNTEMQKIISDRINYSGSDGFLDVLIHPTIKCNLKCQYCFQLEDNNVEKMNLQTAVKTVDMLKNIVHKYNISKLNITWSGGEPLLSLERILFISKSIKENLNLRLSMRLITNGLLLSNKTLAILCNIGITSIQVTIDALHESQDKKRTIYKRDTSMSTIAENIDNLIANYPSIHTAIRMNVDKSNINDYPKVFDYYQNKHSYKNYSITPVFVENYSNFIDNILTREERASFYIKYADIINMNSLFEKQLIGCIKIRRNSLAISPDGSICDCEIEVSDKSKVINDLENYDIEKEFSQQIRKKCLKCSLFPICNWGCMKKQCHIMKGNEKKFIKLQLMD